MILLLLIVVARDNTRVDRGDPAIAVLSIATGPRLTTPRSGWSAATSCIDPLRTLPISLGCAVYAANRALAATEAGR